MTSKKKEITAEQQAECFALKAIYEKKKGELGITQASLSEYIGISQSAVNHYLTGLNALNALVASKFAIALQVSVGNFSNRLAAEIGEMAQSISDDQLPSPISTDSVTLRQFDISVSCGPGIINADFPELIRTIEIPKDKIKELLGRDDLNGIDIINVPTDSMAPTIPKKSLAFLDTRVRNFTNDGIYAFVLNGEAYMKRLQRVPGKIIAISDNPHYKPFEISMNDIDDFTIAAQFIAVLPLEFHPL